VTKDSNRIAIALIEDHEGRILFGNRNDGKGYTTPGGSIHEGEEPIKGLIRELKEETGLLPLSADLVDISFNDEKNIFLYLYKVKLEYTPLTPLEDGWSDPDEECESWDFYWPNDLKDKLHVPIQDNVVIKYWANN